MKGGYLRIVPLPDQGGEETKSSRGVRVLMPDGTPINGVVGIKLETGLDDPKWRATITLDVNVSSE